MRKKASIAIVGSGREHLPAGAGTASLTSRPDWLPRKRQRVSANRPFLLPAEEFNPRASRSRAPAIASLGFGRAGSRRVVTVEMPLP